MNEPSRPRARSEAIVVDFDVISSVRPSVFEDDDATTRLPDEAAPSDGPFEVLGYRLERKLSCGGGVSVHRAVHVTSGSPSIVKWLPRRYVDYPLAVRALYTEAQLAQRFGHRAVAGLAFADEGAAGCLLAYERPAGAASLAAVASRLQARVQALPVGLAARVMVEVARGLGYLTGLEDRAGASLGLAVAKLSPNAVWLGPRGEVVLATHRLGVAPERSGVLAAGLEDGDVPYVAPECLVGEPWTPRSAVYTAGIMLYELLAGRRAYAEVRPGAHAERALSSGPSLAALAQEAVPEALVKLTERAVAREPAARWPSPDALADALEAWLAGEPEAASEAVLGRFLEAHDLLRAPPPPRPAIVSARLEATVVDPPDEAATVRGSVAELEAALARPSSAAPRAASSAHPWAAVPPSPLLFARLPVRGAPAPAPEPSEEDPTRRGHVIPAVLLSPPISAIGEGEEATAVAGPPRPPPDLEPVGPTLVPPAPRRGPEIALALAGVGIGLAGLLAGLLLA